METFREEHYEVEEQCSDGSWVAYDGKFSQTSASELTDDIREEFGTRVRIIRCTTVREVVE